MAECLYADCRLCWVSFTLSVANRLSMLSFVVLNIIMLSVCYAEYHYYSEKYVWLHNSLLFNLQCYWQVLQTSTDPDQQFSAPFKAGNSRQVQTCYKPTVQWQRKLQHFLVYSGEGETGTSTTLNHWVSTQQCSPLCACKRFHCWQCIKLLHFVSAELSHAVITLWLVLFGWMSLCWVLWR